MSRIKVLITPIDPWIHAINRDTKPNETLCGIDRGTIREFYDTEKDYLEIAESLPHHRVFPHICGICWWKYSH